MPLRILHTTPFIPLPPDSGGKLVPFHHITGLAARGHHITFLAPVRRSGDAAALEKMPGPVRVIPVSCARVSSAALAMRFAATGDSLRVTRHSLPETRKACRELLARETFDVAILDTLFTAHLLPVLEEAAPRMPVLLVDHNAESVLFERYLQRQGAPARIAGRVELARIRRAEAAALRGADMTIALSEEDRAHLLKLAPDAEIATLPPGADVFPGETIAPPPDDPVVLFLGDYAWEPNRDAAFWLGDEILPLIRKEVPEAVLHLAGNDSAGKLERLREVPGVRLLGRVPHAGRAIREAVVCVVPLRIGSGVRLKILEALANERPVVTTSLGGEGIPLVHGTNALIGDDARTIARDTAELLRDRSRARRIAGAGRLLAETEFGWNAILDRLDSIVAQLAGGAADYLDA